MQQQRMEPLGLWVLLDLLVRLVPMHHPQDPQVLLAVTEPPEQLDPQERRVLREMEEVLDPQVPQVPLVPLAVPAS